MDLSALPRYLRMPLRGGALGVIVVFALLLALALRGGIMGIPLGLMVLSWFFKYTFVLLDHVVDGGNDPPALAVEMMNPVSEQRSLVLLLMVTGIFFASNAASFWFGPVLGALLGLVLVFILPAVVGVQGVTGSLLQSLNLHRCIRLIARLGRYYVLIVACAAVLLACAVVIANVAWLPLPLRFAFDMYACLAVFAVIGGVLFERRLDIGLDAAHSPERVESKAAADTEREHQHLLDRIYAEWRGGSHITACKTINDLLQASASPGDELEWLYTKTASWPDVRLPNQLAQAWLPHLLMAKRNSRVLEVLKERLAADPTFRPSTSTELLRCARLARDGGERRIARMLLEGFEQRFPADDLHRVATDLAKELAR